MVVLSETPFNPTLLNMAAVVGCIIFKKKKNLNNVYDCFLGK
jgi:hypothetical protein